MEKSKMNRLAPQERDELKAILRAHRLGRAGDPSLTARFYSSFNDAFA